MNDYVKLFIADDHPVFRSGLVGLIEKDAQLQIVGEASDGTEAIEKIPAAGADIAILDIDMPGKDGFEVAQKIRGDDFPIKVIFLTMHKDEDFLHKALELDIEGYLLKESAAKEIIDCIKAVAAGRIFISPAISGLLLKRTRQAEKARDTTSYLEKLTQTERRILSMIADYKTSREIADALFVSFRTIESHRINIARKLDIKGSHALIKYAIENKLLIG